MDAKRVTPDQFKKETLKPGTKGRYLVTVGELSTGTEIAIPVVVVRGSKDGPNVFVGGGVHGEEAGSIEAVKRFAAQLDPKDVSGTVSLVPLQNAPAWAFRSRLYPLDAPTVANMGNGGLAKGDPDGIMTSRALYALADCVAKDAQFALDVHATHLDSMNYPFTFVFTAGDEPADVQKKRLDLARKVGNEIIWVSTSVSNRGGLPWILNHRGCPSVSFEAGEGWRALEPFPSILIRGIRNFLKAAGSLKGDPEMPSVQIEVAKRHEATCSRGGMSHLYVRPGEFVHAGQKLAEVRDMFDDVIEELKAPANGIIQRCSLLPTVATGARLCNIAITDRDKDWENRTIPKLERQIILPGKSRP